MKERDITEIIVHCSATIEGKDFNAKDINQWHTANGWAGIGYHYVVKIDGTVEKGRDVRKIGAHCYGHNKHSVGVCYIGGLDAEENPKDTRTAEQKDSLWHLVNMLKIKYPKAKVYGHRDFSKKACPCFDAKSEYNS